MPDALRLSELVNEIQETIKDRFQDEEFWITTEITDVKKYPEKRWCFLKLIEKEGKSVTTEIKGVFWGGTYYQIEKFERQTGQAFTDGLQVNCLVRINFHKRYGLTLELQAIDATYALGKLALERDAVINRLLKENPSIIQLINGQYITQNNTLPLPVVLQRIALICAPGSDGERDFLQEASKNQQGYAFYIRKFPVLIQGDQSSTFIREQLAQIETMQDLFDIVVIVRGGGSQTDFRPFDDYELSKAVADFPIPVLTGIGHDRNTSIVDLMARANKTPTKVATAILDHNFTFEQQVLDLKERFFKNLQELMLTKRAQFLALCVDTTEAASGFLLRRTSELAAMTRLVRNLSPSMMLTKGFAILIQDGQIISDPDKINEGADITTILKSTNIHSNVYQKTPYKNEHDL